MTGSQAMLLGEVCEIIMGQAPPGAAYNDEERGYPLIAGAGDFVEFHPAPQKWTTVASKLSRDGDIIVGIRASIGEAVWSDGVYCLGRGVAALRPSRKVERNFLWHWLLQARPELRHRARGATFKQVNSKDIATLDILLPPLPEQRRIAAILDQADSLRAKRREALAKLDEMTQAIFVEMFGDPGSGSHKHAVARLAEVAELINGDRSSKYPSPHYA